MGIEWLKELANFGALGAILVFLMYAMYRGIGWLGRVCIKPLFDKMGLWIDVQIQTVKDNQAAIAELVDLEHTIKDTLTQGFFLINEEHSKEHHLFSTYHTNHAIDLLSRMIVRLGKVMEVDLDDLADKLRSEIDKQKTR